MKVEQEFEKWWKEEDLKTTGYFEPSLDDVWKAAYALGRQSMCLSINRLPLFEAGISQGRREGLEEAARIAESMHKGWVTAEVADAIRKLIKE